MDLQDSRNRSLQEQAHLLKEFGYDGAGHVGWENIPERIKTLDAVGPNQIDVPVSLAPDKPPYDSSF